MFLYINIYTKSKIAYSSKFQRTIATMDSDMNTLEPRCFRSNARICPQRIAFEAAQAINKHMQRIAQLIDPNEVDFNQKLCNAVCNVARQYGLHKSEALDVCAEVYKINGLYTVQTSLAHEAGADFVESNVHPPKLPSLELCKPNVSLMSMHELDKELEGWY